MALWLSEQRNALRNDATRFQTARSRADAYERALNQTLIAEDEENLDLQFDISRRRKALAVFKRHLNSMENQENFFDFVNMVVNAKGYAHHCGSEIQFISELGSWQVENVKHLCHMGSEVTMDIPFESTNLAPFKS